MLLSPQTAELVKSVLPSLAEPAIDLDHNKTDGRQRTFDISIAQAMTALSALVYERHDAKVTEAYKMLLRNPKDDQLVADAKRLIWESERPIRQIAKTFNLHFSGITELKSLGGPFCGIYWSDSHPFIIVTFKGTTPTNYSEFLVDATFQRTDARGFLFGAVHQGFYDGLFPKGDEDERDPYFAIQSTILEKAEYLKQKLGTDKPIQVWIAGHSLGSALGGLLFARWLKSTEDISPTCELRDAYLIGCPALGDNNFASLFASYSNVPSTRTSTMWRIINKSDMICRLPPGYNSPTVGHYMPTTDFFNYSHVGHAVQITYPILHHYPLKSYPSNYQPNLHVDIIPGAWQGNSDYSNRKIINPITKLESFYPFFIRDHIPINYFKGLERARMHYMTKQKDDASQQNEMIKSLDI
jgi:hypothetical protein